MSIEYRICWNASSDATFRGATDWEPWENDGDPEETLGECEDRSQRYNAPVGLEIALEASGFEWWVEMREVAAAQGTDATGGGR